MAFKVSCYPPCIRSTSVSAISMTSLPTCTAICTIFCNFSGSTPRPAAYPSVNPTDSQSTTFRFLETELSGTVATLYRFVVTKISLGSASKNIVSSTWGQSEFMGWYNISRYNYRELPPIFLRDKGNSIFLLSVTFETALPNRRRLGRRVLHVVYGLTAYPLEMPVPHMLSLMGHLPTLYAVINSFVMLFGPPAIMHLMVEGYHSIKSTSTHNRQRSLTTQSI